jgi:hypothetical protein
LRFSCIEYALELKKIADRQRGRFNVSTATHATSIHLAFHDLSSILTVFLKSRSGSCSFEPMDVLMQHPYPEFWVPGVLQLVVDGVHGGTAAASTP